jgi:hypothetical protein
MLIQQQLNPSAGIHFPARPVPGNSRIVVAHGDPEHSGSKGIHYLLVGFYPKTVLFLVIYDS